MADERDKPAWQPSSPLAQRFAGMTPTELDILEHGGRFLYPETIRRKQLKEGTEQHVKVRVRVPNNRERVFSRRDALHWAAKMLERDAPKPLTIEGIKAVVGETYWEHLDNLSLLSYCVFEDEAPHERYMLPELLDSHHPHAALYELFERLNWWAQQEDPRIPADQLDEATVYEIAAAIARRGNTSPLLVIDGRAQVLCVISMAQLLTSSRTDKSSSGSPATST